MPRLLLVSLVSVLAIACFEESLCGLSAASSVTVSVRHADGTLATTDDATYTVDGSAEAPCDPLDDFGGEYVCGWEESGWFEIEVHVGGDVFTDALEVPLRADGCVDSQFIDIVID